MAFFKNKFDSIKQDWNTPKTLFEKLNQEFHFEWDLAASKDNSLCSKFYTKEQDGLKQEWSGVCWLNPPYGDKTSKMVDWIKKAYISSQENPNLTIVMLIPNRSNTKSEQYQMVS
jgi:phage N-6-adenine-methyltransferase